MMMTVMMQNTLDQFLIGSLGGVCVGGLLGLAESLKMLTPCLPKEKAGVHQRVLLSFL